jgi:hypothetical protein
MAYTYTLPITAFLNDKVDVESFQQEVDALGLSSAVLEAIHTHATDVNLIFDVEPSAGDKAAVDGAAAVHDGESPAQIAILDLVPSIDQSRDVRVIDYKTGLDTRLHKVVKTMYRGEVREVDYYVDETEAELVLSVKVYADEACTTLGYSRTVLGQPIERWTKRTWFRKDGEVGAEKITHKVYTHDPAAQMAEGIRRRSNTIDKLSVDVLRAYVFTTAVDPMNPTDVELATAYQVVTAYMDKYEAGVTTFIRVGRNDFLTPPESPNVTDDTDPWLDNSVEPMGYPTGWTIRTIMLESIKNISE